MNTAYDPSRPSSVASSNNFDGFYYRIDTMFLAAYSSAVAHSVAIASDTRLSEPGFESGAAAAC